jgi:uridine kinase
MVSRFIRHPELAAALLGWNGPRQTSLVCIDGAGASGKSTIARGLAAACSAIRVVSIDDFYRPSRERYTGPPRTRPVAADFDLDRLRREVLEPLRAGRAAAHRKYIWTLDAVTDERTPVMAPLVLVEGVYSASAALAPFFDLSIWVVCPRDVRLSRGLTRDGEAARPRWELDWMPGEDHYIEAEHPERSADAVCDGARADLDDGVALLSTPGGRAPRSICLD